mmetsp:Transcript_62160/g.111956  ORF Transcript_62160/g.111956 Transcript_62160/m.111956 type:complete len:969 (+) Transcript_62160:3-2909(+)
MMSALQTIGDFILGSKAEILVFLLAAGIHFLLFGKHGLGSSASSKHFKQGAAKEIAEAADSGDCSPASQPQLVGTLIRALKPLLRPGSAAAQQQQDFETAIRSILASGHECRLPTESIIVAMLEGLGRAACNAELLAAVQAVLGGPARVPGMRLAELLLRSYLGLRAKSNFDRLLSEVEAAAVASGRAQLPLGIAVLALQAALGSNNLSGAVGRLAAVAAGWQQQKAPLTQAQQKQVQQLMQQLARLSAEQGSVSVVFEELVKCDFLVAASLEPVFAEAAQQGDHQTTQRVEIMAKDHGVVLTPSARCAFLVGLVSNGSPHSKVLEHYTQNLSDVDVLTAHTKAGGIVAEAALRLDRDDVLKLLLKDCEETRKVGLLKSFGAGKRLDDVRRLFEACPEKTACLHNALLDATLSSGDASSMGKIMQEATRTGLADVVTYNTMIKGHLQRSDLQGALKVVDAMRSSGLQPNCVTFNELIDASMASNPEAAWSLIDEMKACGLKPNKVTCSILLKSVQQASNTRPAMLERAISLLGQIEDGMDEVLLSSVCEACIRANRADLLLPHLRRQKSSKAVNVQGAHTFGSLFRAFGYVNDLEGVWACWRDMKARHILPTSITLGCMVEALVMNEEIEAGYELIREVKDNPETKPLVNSVMYGSVLKGFCHQKRFDRVWVVYGEMLAQKMLFSVVTFNSLIDACARSGDMHRVQPLLEEMSSQGIEPNIITYSTVLKGYCSANRLNDAFELMEHMKKNTRLTPDEVTYNTLLDGCARQGLFDRGMSVLDEMRQVRVPPSNFTLSVLVKLAIRAKKPSQRAFDLVEEISKEFRLRPNVHVYNNLIQACTCTGDLRRGLAVLERLLGEKVRPDHRTYALLLRAAVAGGRSDDVAQLLRSAAGLRGGHASTAAASSLAPLRDGARALQRDLLTEVLEYLSSPRGNAELAQQVMWELSRQPGVQLDPKLRLCPTSEALRR